MATFETLAAKCAAGVALDLLVAIANVESGVDPFAVRDGTILTRVLSPGEGVALALGAADEGRETRVGLMGLTERQLRAAGRTLTEGFDSCMSLTTAAMIIQAAQKTAQGLGKDAADRAAIRTWWRADTRFPSIATFEAAIARERGAATLSAKREIVSVSPKQQAPSASDETVKGETSPSQAASQRAASTIMPDCWDIFARQRAGVAQCDERAHADPPAPRPSRPEPETAAIVIFGSRETSR